MRRHLEAIDFTPSRGMLEAVAREFEALGNSGGGAVDPRVRQDALAGYERLSRVREKSPPRWRHDYRALSFDGLVWSSGRVRVPALPRHEPRARVANDESARADAPALALENAGGLVHLGSTYLEPAQRLGDPRVTLLALADAKRTMPERVAAVAGRVVAADADRFTALTTAFQNCGAYVEVPAEVTLDAPLQLLWSSRPGETSAVFAQTIVRLGPNARATILERHAGSTESFVCGTVEIELGPGAQLDYVVVQQADEGARVLVHRGARCEAGARIGWHLAELGGALARSVITTRLEHARAEAELNALFFARGFGHVDLTTAVDHRASETRSRTVVRGVATGRGQGRFRGGILIRPDTHRCDASLRDDSLLLSRDSYLEAIPALDIGSNDVSASHAATVGALDEEELFYVQSRGIARGRAERMIALAFFEAAIARFPGEALRDEVRTALDAELDDVPETFAQ
jgi:Fe-S cluster assembly protein SufD